MILENHNVSATVATILYVISRRNCGNRSPSELISIIFLKSCIKFMWHFFPFRANQEGKLSSDSKLPNLPSAMEFYLEKEINKAAGIVTSFKTTLDGQDIPRRLLAMAKGVVFFTIIKLGFVFTGRYGTGLIVARLPDGRWSAPSAVQMTGVGWGLQVGAELTTVMLILSTESAVKAFKSSAQISVGAELGVSVGPVGRSLETDVSAGHEGTAHAFSYAQSKGLFVGASLEASGIASRPDVNRAFYGEEVAISALLQGEIPPPKGAEVLYQALNELMVSSKAAVAAAAAEAEEKRADVVVETVPDCAHKDDAAEDKFL